MRHRARRRASPAVPRGSADARSSSSGHQPAAGCELQDTPVSRPRPWMMPAYTTTRTRNQALPASPLAGRQYRHPARSPSPRLTLSGLRQDRIFNEAADGVDPLRLLRLFGITEKTAMHSAAGGAIQPFVRRAAGGSDTAEDHSSSPPPGPRPAGFRGLARMPVAASRDVFVPVTVRRLSAVVRGAGAATQMMGGGVRARGTQGAWSRWQASRKGHLRSPTRLTALGAVLAPCSATSAGGAASTGPPVQAGAVVAAPAAVAPTGAAGVVTSFFDRYESTVPGQMKVRPAGPGSGVAPEVRPPARPEPAAAHGPAATARPGPDQATRGGGTTAAAGDPHAGRPLPQGPVIPPSLRSFSRAPCTRIRSWLWAACGTEDRGVGVCVCMCVC